MTRWLLTLELIDSPILLITGGLAVVLAVVVVVVPPRHPWRLLIATVAGGIVGYAVVRLLEGAGTFQGPLPGWSALEVAVGLGVAVGGIVAAFTRPWWRRILAILLVIAALLSAGLAVNRNYAMTHTLAAILGVQSLDAAPLPTPTSTADEGDPATLYERWQPPADMPKAGRVSALSGSQRIPDEGFAARDAALYLPPAALVADPPKLPLLVFMMGQPGTPDPTSLAKALDAYAAAHNGLAPIAIVADQLGSINADPACADSARYGKVATYFRQDIPAWATANLNILTDHAYWTIGGYSNGGSCAFTWGAQDPKLWGNIMDVSGNEYPGSEHTQQTIDDVYGGDAAAYTAALPKTLLQADAGSYTGHVAVFTHGDQDTVFGPGQVSNAQLAQDAGFTVYARTISGVNHTGPALDQGLATAIADLGPHLGLAPPAS